MPEGDTIATLAARMNILLNGCSVQQLDVFKPRSHAALASLSNVAVSAVQSRGKHLFINFECGHTLHTHLGMHGSWHGYTASEPWQQSVANACAVLRSEAAGVFVCFKPAEIVLLAPRGDAIRRRQLDARIGPDLACLEDADELGLRVRQTLADTALLVDALLDQKIAAGIGNVFKSELMFAHKLHPACTLAQVTDEQLVSIYATAARWIRSNVGAGRRRTRGSRFSSSQALLSVYGRTAKPCFECGATIVSVVHGRHFRRTYWCPQCQPEAAAPVHD